uniref:DNA-directed RNA polymerases I and III subunit RPAC2 n=1 Tax=Denticeps clupeoides TaxID=299321 RepID=A0AAY4E7P2_9TELE
MARKETETKPVLEMVQADGADEGCVTFVLHEEDHTLGNSLRYMVMKNPQVEFCGYSIPHPSETKINFRIQSRGGVPATDLLRKGLKDLQDAAQHVRTTFEVRLVSLHPSFLALAFPGRFGRRPRPSPCTSFPFLFWRARGTKGQNKQTPTTTTTPRLVICTS